MELRQLEYFVAVAEEANFTRGAERVRVAQPGVSAQIRRLERELGHPLFDRSARQVRLTDVGAAVLPYARAALAATAGARTAVEELAGFVRGRVAVGMVTACSTPSIFNLLAEFHAAYPTVEITLTEANSDELIARLRDGVLDLALVGVAGPDLAGLASHVILDESMVAAVHRDDPLARRSGVRLADLRNRQLITLPRGTGIRTCIDNSGVRVTIAFEASDPGAVAQLAVRRLGVAILPGSLAALEPELHAVPITAPVLRSRIELAWKPDVTASPAARALIALAARVTQSNR
jgi:DNA-binding transcriptional LysR family regulator